MPSLITDDQGLPKPQYEQESGTSFESQKGKEGASFSYVKDGHNEALGKMSDPEERTSLIGLTKAVRTILGAIRETLTAMRTRLDELPRRTDITRISNVSIGSGAIVGVVEIGASAVELRIGSTAKTNRRMLKIFNHSDTEILYIGFATSVTAANGFPIMPKTEATLNLDSTVSVPVYAVAGNTMQARILEA